MSYSGKLLTAWKRGRMAREQTPETENPYRRREYRTAWQDGFDSLEVRTQELPPVHKREPATVTRETRPHLFWPEGVPHPHRWTYHYPPCVKCERILTETRTQAVVATSTGVTVVYLHCRCCGHRWAIPR